MKFSRMLLIGCASLAVSAALVACDNEDRIREPTNTIVVGDNGTVETPCPAVKRAKELCD